MEQLELAKPPPPGPDKYVNYPLLLSLLVLVAGLGLVLANLSSKKVSLVVKSVGPVLVMTGLTTLLVRILFSYTPSVMYGWCIGSCGEGRVSKPVENIRNNTRVADSGLSVVENLVSDQNFRSR